VNPAERGEERARRRTLAAAGLAHARAGRFFAAHEAWEGLWLELRGDERLWLQALIQVAVALHHAEAGNAAGRDSLAEKAAVKLERLAALEHREPEWATGLGLPAPRPLLRALADWRAGGDAAPLFP
jgi:hypothetical protein